MQNYYNDYYQFGVWDGVKNTWNTIRAIPKIASGIGAIKDFGKTGDFNKLVDWGKENFKGNPMIDKAISWAKDNKALLGGLATAGVGALANHFANKNNQKQVMMGMMPGMGGGMMPMMNPYMGMMPMMNPYMGMGMMPGMGGGYYTVTRGNNNGNGFFGNLMQAATPLLAAYGINKWMNGQQKTDEEKKKEEETNAENDIQGRLNKLYAANPNNSNDIKQEYDSLLRSLGDEKGALATLEAKYKGGWFKPEEQKEAATPQTAAEKIDAAFGKQRTGYDWTERYDQNGLDKGSGWDRFKQRFNSSWFGRHILKTGMERTSNAIETQKDRDVQRQWEGYLSGKPADFVKQAQEKLAQLLDTGMDHRTAALKTMQTFRPNQQSGNNEAPNNTTGTQGNKKTQAIANATTDSQDPAKNPYADFSYSPLDEIQGRFKDVYFGSWSFLSPETKKKDVKALAARIKPGDGISVNKGTYAHYAVYIGDGKVIEHTGMEGKGQREGNNKSQIGTLKDFLAGQNNATVTVHKSKKFDPETVVRRAKNAYNLKDLPYDPAKNNCEHFMEEILNGEHKSHQVGYVQKLARGLGYGGLNIIKNYDKDIDKSAKKYSKMYKHI